MIPSTQRTEDLVELMLRIIQDKAAPEIKTLVGHRFPDDDVWLCCWMAKKFVPKTANAKIVFVNAGESLPGSEGDPSVLHFDTGGGNYDQHGKRLKRTCSAVLLAKELDLDQDPSLKALLEMATAVDNVEPLPVTNIHYAIEGYPRTLKPLNGRVDWDTVQARVFELFDMIHGHELRRHLNRQNLSQYVKWATLSNGLRVALVLWHPEFRDAAYETGATVVIWTSRKGTSRFYTGIQVSRTYPNLYLDNVAFKLRYAEAQKLQIDVRGKNLVYLDREELDLHWFMHDSRKLILNGSRTWELKEDEYTKLSLPEIVGCTFQGLSMISRETVSRWDRK